MKNQDNRWKYFILETATLVENENNLLQLETESTHRTDMATETAKSPARWSHVDQGVMTSWS